MKKLIEIALFILIAGASYIMFSIIFSIDANPIEPLPPRGYAYYYSHDWHVLRKGNGNSLNDFIEWNKRVPSEIPLYAIWIDIIHEENDAMILQLCWKTSPRDLRRCTRVDWDGPTYNTRRGQ